MLTAQQDRQKALLLLAARDLVWLGRYAKIFLLAHQPAVKVAKAAKAVRAVAAQAVAAQAAQAAQAAKAAQAAQAARVLSVVQAV